MKYILFYIQYLTELVLVFTVGIETAILIDRLCTTKLNWDIIAAIYVINLSCRTYTKIINLYDNN